MGFDSDDGGGERVILGERGSYVKPLITPDGSRIVYSTRPKPGPAEVFIVNWDGSERRKLGDGFALGLWKDPDNGRQWVFAGTDMTNWEFATIWRFPIDDPAARAVAWNGAPVSIDNFQVSSDGRFAAGMYPVARGGGCRPPHEDAEEARSGLLAGADHGARRPLLVLRRSAPEPDDGRRRGGRTLDRQREQRARIRRGGSESSPLDEPSAIHDALRSVQPGRSESGKGRRAAGRNLARPFQRRLLADRGVGAGDQQRRRRLAARRLD